MSHGNAFSGFCTNGTATIYECSHSSIANFYSCRLKILWKTQFPLILVWVLLIQNLLLWLCLSLFNGGPRFKGDIPSNRLRNLGDTDKWSSLAFISLNYTYDHPSGPYEISEEDKALNNLSLPISAVIKDFELMDAVTEIVQKFLESPSGRTKDIVPNLFVIFGYIVCLPTEKLQQLFGADKSEYRIFYYLNMILVF